MTIENVSYFLNFQILQIYLQKGEMGFLPLLCALVCVHIEYTTSLVYMYVNSQHINFYM